MASGSVAGTVGNGPDPFQERGHAGVRRRRRTPGDPVENVLIGLIEQPFEPGAAVFVQGVAGDGEKPFQDEIQLAGTPAAAPSKTPVDHVAGHRQSWRTTIIFLISAIAFAGLSPFGQARVQFMMVWHR